MHRQRSRFLVSIFGGLLCTSVSAQVTQRVSLDSRGAQGNSNSGDPSISADGRYVAFSSAATNLISGDTNGHADIFVRDRQSGVTEIVSVSSGGAQGNDDSYYPSISADGRHVAFYSLATNLVSGDTNGAYDVFVRDRQTGVTERVSVSSGGLQGNDHSVYPSISADGRYVAFQSHASNLVSGDTNHSNDVFVRDRQIGVTDRVSVSSTGVQGNSVSNRPSISAGGRYVAFYSYASNLVSGDTNNWVDVFVHDRRRGRTERVSVPSSGYLANADSGVYGLSISADGRYVAFESLASNLVSGDTNGSHDVFVRDRQIGVTERVSIDSGGAQGNGDSGLYGLSISADGRYVAFQSNATNLVSQDTNVRPDVFVRDRQRGLTERVSVDSSGAQGNDYTNGASISADGRYVSFHSDATNLVSGDTNGWKDVFVRDRLGGTDFTSLCDPGASGVISCPCANPPSGPGRGCDNSSATGGAILSASGGTYFSSDSLMFTTSDERPTATSIVLQGDAVASNGVVYGQGVRCVGGTLKRLYTKAASGGSITAPNLNAGDTQVSVRSASLGDVIQPGQSRYYLVYYRDPVVLGGCPASATFDATQTGQVTWWP